MQKKISFSFALLAKVFLCSSKYLFLFQSWHLVENLFYIIDFFSRETLDNMAYVYWRTLIVSSARTF